MSAPDLAVCFLHIGRLPPRLRGRKTLFARAVWAALRPFRARGEVTVVFLGDAAMRALNKARLGHDYITDVIAFGYQKGTNKDIPLPAGDGTSRARRAGEGFPFGDIVICVPQARRQAKDLGHDLLTELVTLAAHGALHLAGYRDGSLAARKRMFRRQNAVVRATLSNKAA